MVAAAVGFVVVAAADSVAVGLVVVVAAAAAADPVADRTKPALQRRLLHPRSDVHMSVDMLLKRTGDAQAQRRNHNMD